MKIIIIDDIQGGSEIVLTNDNLDNPNFVYLETKEDEDGEVCISITELKHSVDTFYQLMKECNSAK